MLGFELALFASQFLGKPLGICCAGTDRWQCENLWHVVRVKLTNDGFEFVVIGSLRFNLEQPLLAVLDFALPMKHAGDWAKDLHAACEMPRDEFRRESFSFVFAGHRGDDLQHVAEGDGLCGRVVGFRVCFLCHKTISLPLVARV